MQLEAIASHPITSYLGEETNTSLTTASFQVVVESKKVSPQPPSLQTKQPQLPQPLLVRLVKVISTTAVSAIVFFSCIKSLAQKIVQNQNLIVKI